MNTQLSDYITTTRYEQWIVDNFEDKDEIQGLLDGMAYDDVYPAAFIDSCIEAYHFDNGMSIYEILSSPEPEQSPEEEDIDHEFHFLDNPIVEQYDNRQPGTNNFI